MKQKAPIFDGALKSQWTLPAWEQVCTSGLRLSVTTVHDNAIFAQFFESYDRAFVLQNEKEEAGGFRQAMELNWGASYLDLQGRIGPFREVCLLAFDGAALVGGANFFAMQLDTGHQQISSNLNYLFVEPAQRQRGYMKRILMAIDEVIASMFSAKPPVLMFIEQNDPFRLTEEEYLLDSKVSGIDQFERLYVWAKAGAKLIMHPYVQPPLSDSQDADNTLVYSLLGNNQMVLSPNLLKQHLEGFFSVSVLKGAPLSDNPLAMAQLNTLDAMGERGQMIPLRDIHGWLKKVIDGRGAGFLQTLSRPPSLLEALTAN